VKLHFALALLVTTVFFAPITLVATEVSPEALEQYQKIFVRTQQKQLEGLIAALHTPVGVHRAEKGMDQLRFLSPSGRYVLHAIARNVPQPMDRWLLLIFDNKTKTVRAIFDFLNAHTVERVTWLDDNRLLLLDRTQRLSDPPGRLFFFNLVKDEAVLLDKNVWRYAVVENGDSILFERNVEDGDFFAERALVHLQLGDTKRHLVHSVQHPMVQFGEITGPQEETSFLGFNIHEYSKERFEPKVVQWLYDPLARRAFKKTTP